MTYICIDPNMHEYTYELFEAKYIFQSYLLWNPRIANNKTILTTLPRAPPHNTVTHQR